MKTLNILFTFALLTAACVAPAFAQHDTLRPRWGVFGGLAINTHSADFRALPGAPNCCPRFESGSGLGPIVGAAYEFPVGNALLLSLGVGYADHSAILSTREPVAIVAAGETRDGAFEHTIDAKFASVAVEPALSLRLFDRLFVRGEIRVGTILSPTYSQKEEIVEPVATGTFLDSLGNDSGLRTRNTSSGEIPEAASVVIQGGIGVGYELPLNARRTLMLVPGISYSQSFTDVVSGYSWKANALRLTLGLKYSPLPSRPVLRDTTYRRDTTVVTIARGGSPDLRLDDRTESVDSREDGPYLLEHYTVTERYIRQSPKQSLLSATISAVGVEGTVEEPVATLRVEEFLRTNTHPLLGYLFFGEGSVNIPSRYVRMTGADADLFEPKTLFEEDAMTISHNVLNILGYNLRRHPGAGLTITGCNSGNGTEQGNRTLSRGRAEAVKRYLADVWKIEPGRLTVVARDLPSIPSNTTTADGSEENRRVEITSDVPEVTDVFVAYDTARSASPPALRFKPVVGSTDPLVSWKLTVSQRGTILKEFSGRGAPPASLDWTIAAERQGVPGFSEPLAVQIEATTSEGETTTATTALATDVITVRRKEAERSRDYRVEQYNLVLFDVGKSTITDAHRRTIELVKSRLKPESTITIEGYSDRTGDEGANRRLARSRAQSTATALGRNDARVTGIGEDRLLYDNDIPEGRFYCRTVSISVRTPVR